jgi:hypothetical protein
MYGDLGKAIEALIWFIVVLLVVAVPLALWKIIEVGGYLFNHIGVTWK